MRLRAAALLLAAALSAGAARKPDPLAAARQFYNLGQYDQAVEAAREAAANPATASSARLVLGRARLERYRQKPTPEELEGARTDLRGVDPRAVDARERVELQVGFGVLLYFEDRFGAAAELLAPIVDASELAPDARERALDWWATALDREAQALPPVERAPIYARITERIEQELRRDPSSTPAGYWLAAAARGLGDLDRAWAAASAGWIRSSLNRDRGTALRADLDRLVTQAIIPEKAAKAPARERRQAAATLAEEWEAFKKIW
ncbi:MAG TPA: hypothetical protein VL225_03565 [Vicinamibacterales bacterium]|jgi:hypothetical protein|nr:hypothetical protein [Vicinamibacterales bacterium]